MKITNKLELPQPFVDAVTAEYTYKPKRYSVTTLLNDNKEILLKRRHNNEMSCDVSDMVWAIFGTAVHKVLEEANTQDHLLKEHYLFVRIGEYELSGICDLYDTQKGEVIDYKVVSTYKCLKGDFADFRKQGLIYCYMLNKLGHTARMATFYMILRDWQGSKAKYERDYPKTQVQRKTFKFTDKDFAEIEEWLYKRFESLQRDEQLPDDEIPECSAESRWHTEDTFAVMRKGRKSALRVLTNRKEAEQYKEKHGGDYIEERIGADRKCQEYCSCAAFCNYYQQTINNKKGE